MPPVSTTTRTTSPRKRRRHGKPPSAGTTSTPSGGSPRFDRSEQRQRIERPHLTPSSLPGVAAARPECRSAASRAELLHRDHVIHELIDGDLGALVKATRFVRLEVGFIPVQRREDIASAAS